MFTPVRMRAKTHTGTIKSCLSANNPASGRLSFCLFRENFLMS